MKKEVLQILIILTLVLTGCSKSSYTVTNSVNDSEESSSYELVWSDEFDGTTINTDNWSYQEEVAGTYNSEWQEYTNSSDNAYIEDGNMVIKAIYSGNGLSSGNFTSARMITHEKQKFKYGKISARIKVPYGQGIWPAFWMLGSNISENTGGTVAWPNCGEIDIMEKIGGTNNEKKAYGTLHYYNETLGYNPAPSDSYTYSDDLSNDYHIYGIEWDEDSISWYFDGIEYSTIDISSSVFDEFREDFYILLNVAVGGTWPGNPDSTTTFPQRMYIDYVRVYQKSI